MPERPLGDQRDAAAFAAFPGHVVYDVVPQEERERERIGAAPPHLVSKSLYVSSWSPLLPVVSEQVCGQGQPPEGLMFLLIIIVNGLTVLFSLPPPSHTYRHFRPCLYIPNRL